MKSMIDPFAKPGHMIRRLQQYAVLIFHEDTAGFGLTPTQYITLQVVEQKPGIDQITLSEATAIDRSMTARIVDALARAALIDKRPAPGDKRANALFPTAKARRLLTAVEPSVERAQARILAPLSAADRRVFMRMVKSLLDGYDKLRSERLSLHSPRSRPRRSAPDKSAGSR
jgi:MarR family transcriptional regulator, lower aerobic nicotinate degradation pathway regulator